MRILDKVWIGIIVGLLLPLFFLWLFVDTTYHGDVDIKNLLAIFSGTNMMIKLMFIAILPNMFLVFLLNSFEFWKMCKGVFVALFVYIILCIPLIA